MTAALEGGEWSAGRPGRNLPPGKTRYSLYRRLGGPQGHNIHLQGSKLRKHIERGKPQWNIFNTFLTEDNFYNKAVSNQIHFIIEQVIRRMKHNLNDPITRTKITGYVTHTDIQKEMEKGTWKNSNETSITDIRPGHANLRLACPKLHAERFPWHAAFTSVPFFLFCSISVSILRRVRVYTYDCVETVRELQLLPNDTASETFLHKSETMRSVDRIIIIVAPAW